MKKSFNYLLIVSSLFLLTACPYESTVPIAPANEKIDPALLGKWEKTSEEGNYTEISKKDNNTMRIEKFEFNKETNDYKKEVFFAHTTTLDEVKFLNIIKEEDLATPKYYLHKYELHSRGSRLDLFPVTERVSEKFTDSKTLAEFVNKHKKLSFFYETEEKYFIKD